MEIIIDIEIRCAVCDARLETEETSDIVYVQMCPSCKEELIGKPDSGDEYYNEELSDGEE